MCTTFGQLLSVLPLPLLRKVAEEKSLEGFQLADLVNAKKGIAERHAACVTQLILLYHTMYIHSFYVEGSLASSLNVHNLAIPTSSFL